MILLKCLAFLAQTGALYVMVCYYRYRKFWDCEHLCHCLFLFFFLISLGSLWDQSGWSVPQEFLWSFSYFQIYGFILSNIFTMMLLKCLAFSYFLRYGFIFSNIRLYGSLLVATRWYSWTVTPTISKIPDGRYFFDFLNKKNYLLFSCISCVIDISWLFILL